MNRSLRAALVMALPVLLSACGGPGANSALLQPFSVENAARIDLPSFFISGYTRPANVREACAGPAAFGFARCIALVRTDVASADVMPNFAGYGPADLRAAYTLPSSTGGAGQTVAIVDAYNDPTVAADLAKYRSTYGVPACTVANLCFKKVNQAGNAAGPFPANNAGWAQEISLDVDMGLAGVPKCHILLVEANTASFSDLGASVDTAARLGAHAISNSYGGGEFSGEVAAQSHYNHPGVMITASSGDSGYGPQFPAASQFVTAVGGTSLTRNSAAWSESVWAGAGS